MLANEKIFLKTTSNYLKEIYGKPKGLENLYF